MKNTTLLTLTLIILTAFPGLAQDTTWYDAAGKNTTPATAASYRIKTKDTIGWQLTYYYISGKLRSRGSYTDDSLHTRQGLFVYYDEKGPLTRRVNYSGGKKEGKETYYHDNGQIKVAGDNRAGKYIGEWKGYYTTGQLAAEAQFDSGIQVRAKFYNEDGTPNTKIDSFFKNVAYPEGLSAFSRFMKEHIRYPDQARKLGAEGRVYVEFIVSKEGQVTKPTVFRSVSKLLDEEALRVIQLLPAWQPSIFGGMPAETHMVLPVTFRLEK